MEGKTVFGRQLLLTIDLSLPNSVRSSPKCSNKKENIGHVWIRFPSPKYDKTNYIEHGSSHKYWYSTNIFNETAKCRRTDCIHYTISNQNIANIRHSPSTRNITLKKRWLLTNIRKDLDFTKLAIFTCQIVSQQVEAEFSQMSLMKKTDPAKVLSPGASLGQEWMILTKKSGCWPDARGGRALNPL